MATIASGTGQVQARVLLLGEAGKIAQNRTMEKGSWSSMESPSSIRADRQKEPHARVRYDGMDPFSLAFMLTTHAIDTPAARIRRLSNGYD